MTTTSRPPGNPTRPAVRPTRHDFVETLKELRKWSGLTLKELDDRHDILKSSTTSDYLRLRGVRWPRWEWVHAFVTTCLTHRGLTDPVRIQAELAHWRTAWGYVEHHRTGQGQPPEAPRQAHSPEASTPEPTGGVQPGTSDQEEDAEARTRLRTVRSDLIEALGEQPPVAMTVGGEGDPTARNASTEGAGQQLGQAAATPHGERHPAAATRLRHRRWVLSGAAAAVIIAAGAVVATATGVFGTPDSTRPSPSAANHTDPTRNPPPLVPGKTFTETVNTPDGARTYSKPHNLAGEWQRVPNKTNVQVSCVITAPGVRSVGLYWYRIASPPWNNQYYSPANSFLNGDPPDGSSPTHVVDQAVPECPH